MASRTITTCDVCGAEIDTVEGPAIFLQGRTMVGGRVNGESFNASPVADNDLCDAGCLKVYFTRLTGNAAEFLTISPVDPQ